MDEKEQRPQLGSPATCEVCSQQGRWIRGWPSLESESPIIARCKQHEPEDDYT